MAPSVADFATLRVADLEALVRTLREGSLGRAAEALTVPKSTVSRRISRLETELGVRLFERTRAGLRLTDAGRLVADAAEGVLDQLGDLVSAVADYLRAPSGALRVTASTDLAGLSALWLAFVERYPQVSLDVSFTNRYVDVVAEGFDVALRGGLGDDHTLIARRVGSYDLRPVAAPSYLERRGRPTDPAALRNFDTVRLKPGPHDHRAARAAGSRHLVFDDLTAMHKAIVAGHGVGWLPAYLCDADIASGNLEVAIASHDPLTVPVYAVYPDRRYLPATHRVFIALAADVLGPPVQEDPPNGGPHQG